MPRDEFVNLIVKIYTEFFREVSLNYDYELDLSDRNLSLINSFTDSITKDNPTVGKHYLLDFFEFQFNYWHDKDTQFGRGIVMLSWVLGKKAIDRYKNKSTEHYKFFISKNLKKRIGITSSSIIGKNKYDNHLHNLSDMDEIERARFFNMKKGIVWCFNNTNMYHYKSKWCVKCKLKKDCIKITKENYPKKFWQNKGINE